MTGDREHWETQYHKHVRDFHLDRDQEIIGLRNRVQGLLEYINNLVEQRRALEREIEELKLDYGVCKGTGMWEEMTR